MVDHPPALKRYSSADRVLFSFYGSLAPRRSVKVIHQACPSALFIFRLPSLVAIVPKSLARARRDVICGLHDGGNGLDISALSSSDGRRYIVNATATSRHTVSSCSEGRTEREPVNRNHEPHTITDNVTLDRFGHSATTPTTTERYPSLRTALSSAIILDFEAT